MQLMASGTRHTLASEFNNLDAKCSLLPGKLTLRKLILGMQTCASPTLPAGSKKQLARPPGPVFLSVDAAI
jgi:hypothetical protein